MKYYDIYAKEKCVFHSLDENEFQIVWQTLVKMISILETNYTIEDLYYKHKID